MLVLCILLEFLHTNLQVLDIGSGKGYLSEHLALHYGLTVVGLDSQESNTRAAVERNTKVSVGFNIISCLFLLS